MLPPGAAKATTYITLSVSVLHMTHQKADILMMRIMYVNLLRHKAGHVLKHGTDQHCCRFLACANASFCLCVE